jgi:hypothetical protein
MMTIRTILPPIGRDYRLDLLRSFAKTRRSTSTIYQTMSSTGSPSATMGSATQQTYSYSSLATRLVRLCGNDA